METRQIEGWEPIYSFVEWRTFPLPLPLNLMLCTFHIIFSWYICLFERSYHIQEVFQTFFHIDYDSSWDSSNHNIDWKYQKRERWRKCFDIILNYTKHTWPFNIVLYYKYIKVLNWTLFTGWVSVWRMCDIPIILLLVSDRLWVSNECVLSINANICQGNAWINSERLP